MGCLLGIKYGVYYGALSILFYGALLWIKYMVCYE